LRVRVGDAGDDLVGDAMASTRCAELASLAEQADIRWEAALQELCQRSNLGLVKGKR
jgi:hypothetical protein